MVRLGVNIDHVATVPANPAGPPNPIRSRPLSWPCSAGRMASLSTCARIADTFRIAMCGCCVRSWCHGSIWKWPSLMRFVAIACEVKPDEATLVPEKRQELTTEGGLDVVANEAAVARAVQRLKHAGIEVSLFIDPDIRQIETARLLGVQAIEIHTGRYADAGRPRSVS